MRRSVALLLIASRAWAECSSHDDCVGYCRAYSSSNYCRSCGDCMYDGITQWVTADPIDGVCPSRCEELPTLYDNGTLAVFNAATVAVNQPLCRAELRSVVRLVRSRDEPTVQ